MKKLMVVALILAIARMAQAQPDAAVPPERRPPTWDDMGITDPDRPPSQPGAEAPPDDPGLEPRPGQPPEGREPGPPGFAVQRFLDILRENNPEEFERMRKLRQDDPQAFREELNKRLRQERERRGLGREQPSGPGWQRPPPGERDREGQGSPEGGPGRNMDAMNIHSPELDQMEFKSRELARAFREAKDDEAKAKVRDELRASLTQAFDLREKMRRERVEQMEKRLHKLNEMLEQRQSHRDEIIDRRVKELTEADALAW